MINPNLSKASWKYIYLNAKTNIILDKPHCTDPNSPQKRQLFSYETIRSELQNQMAVQIQWAAERDKKSMQLNIERALDMQ